MAYETHIKIHNILKHKRAYIYIYVQNCYRLRKYLIGT